MKKSFLTLTVILTVISITTFAGTTHNADPRAEKAFQQQFAGASNVKWSKVENGYLQAVFTWANHRTIAYFSPDAEFVGSVRNLLFNQLPLSVMRTIDSHFKDDVVIEIKEITNDDGTHYDLIVEQKGKKYDVKINNAGEITEKVKVKK